MTKAFYLNKLFSKRTPNISKIEMESIIDDIANKSCEFLFNIDLKPSLKEFLPEYIKYLAYKIETKRKLKETYDKLEGIIWQNISNIIQSDISEDQENQYEDQIKDIDKKIKSKPEDLGLYYKKIRILNYFNQYKEAINILDKMLVNFPDSEKEIKLLKAAVLRRTHNIKTGLDIINSLIQKFPEDNDLLCYKAYWMQNLDNKKESIEIIKELIKNEPENGVYIDAYGEILMYFEEYDEAVKWFLKAIVMVSDDWYIYQSYIKLGICYKVLEKYDLALKNLKEGKNLADKITVDLETKQKWLAITDLFLSEIKH